MTPERARLIENLYAEALERKAAERTAFLDKACGGDRELFREIESLLAHGTNTGSFMEAPAIEEVLPRSRKCSSCSASLATGSRFCPSCGHPASHASVPTAAAPPTGPTASPTGQTAKHESGARVWFTPGTVLGGRYRIVAFLGRGGMGEVYRADDLTLGLPVALKFLPPALASDPGERERFLAEVRITRQLSHPNICRVYDIAKSDGRYFLSMEYIDGEDLSSLLKRIGYLPPEKALEISRQLLSGLSAAHERGILHRDLKPSNIMLDGRGHVRIMDFGLATMETTEDGGSRSAEVLGTPAYMAPEQFSGRPASARSDIYALGLVLYEIYCGKRAFAAGSIAELKHKKDTETPRAPSELRQGVDPDIDKLIMKCIDRNPLQRPASVRQVAAAFGGEDPLAAALAAGETPSPELVAAFGPKEGLRLRTAIVLLLVFGVAVVGAISMNARAHLLNRLPAGKDPAVLLDRARQYIKDAGYSVEAADTASGLAYDASLIEHIRATDRSPNRWDRLDSQRGVVFWYRQSPRPLERTSFTLPKLTPTDPPAKFSGEIVVRVDMEGRLKTFEAIPESVRSTTTTPGAIDWGPLFRSAGLDMTQWTRVEPKWNPNYFTDTQAAWESTLPEDVNTGLRIEAASYSGKPVRFELIGPWTQPPRVPPVFVSTGLLPLSTGVVLAFIVALGGAVFFARRNLRLGRGDRRGANAIVLALLVSGAVSWVLNEHHVATPWELTLLFMEASELLLVACVSWILYIALEPSVRRRWPGILVASTRLMSGAWRDSLVGREVLIGSVTGACAACIERLGLVLPALLGRPEEFPVERAVGYTFASSFSAVPGIFDGLGWSIGDVLILLFFFLLARTLLRNDWLAAAAVLLLFFLPPFLSADNPWIRGAASWLTGGLALAVLMRVGLVAGVVHFIVSTVFLMYSITFKFSAWYFKVGMIALAWAAAFAIFGFFVSIQGQKLLDIEGIEKPSQ